MHRKHQRPAEHDAGYEHEPTCPMRCDGTVRFEARRNRRDVFSCRVCGLAFEVIVGDRQGKPRMEGSA
jgi:hypothetical protein